MCLTLSIFCVNGRISRKKGSKKEGKEWHKVILGYRKVTTEGIAYQWSLMANGYWSMASYLCIYWFMFDSEGQLNSQLLQNKNLFVLFSLSFIIFLFYFWFISLVICQIFCLNVFLFLFLSLTIFLSCIYLSIPVCLSGP